MKKIIAVMLTLLLSAIFVYSHSGRTDSKGGHLDRKTGKYHYHGSSKSSSTKSTSTVNRLKTSNTKIIPDGDQPYLLTKADWLVMDLNIRYADDSIQFWNKNKNTIQAEVHFTKDITEVGKQNLMEYAKSKIMLISKMYEWDSWVKIEEKFTLKK